MNDTTEINDAFLETERLWARHFREDDLDDFAALCANMDAMRYVGEGEGLARDGVAYWIQVCKTKYATRGYGTSAVFEKATRQFIGYCGVVRAPENDFDELVYVFLPSAWGKGYATEIGSAMLKYVFDISTLNRIYATIHPDNQPSRHVADKLGMRLQEMLTNEDGSLTALYVIERPAKVL